MTLRVESRMEWKDGKPLDDQTAEKINFAMNHGALQMVRFVRDIMSYPGQGITYGKHRASAPGQAPAADTGKLRQSVGAVVFDAGSEIVMDLGVTASADSVQGIAASTLEYGTKAQGGGQRRSPSELRERSRSRLGHSVIAPRPSFSRAAEAITPKIQQMIADGKVFAYAPPGPPLPGMKTLSAYRAGFAKKARKARKTRAKRKKG